jgi:hypothetical protein
MKFFSLANFHIAIVKTRGNSFSQQTKLTGL